MSSCPGSRKDDSMMVTSKGAACPSQKRSECLRYSCEYEEVLLQLKIVVCVTYQYSILQRQLLLQESLPLLNILTVCFMGVFG